VRPPRVDDVLEGFAGSRRESSLRKVGLSDPARAGGESALHTSPNINNCLAEWNSVPFSGTRLDEEGAADDRRFGAGGGERLHVRR
jgi:hypothetical protein